MKAGPFLCLLVLTPTVAHVLAAASAATAAPISVTATQVILRYDARSSHSCTIKVSETDTFGDGYKPVNALNEALFRGSSSDGQSAKGPRYFVVGRRSVAQGADRKWYPLALTADTEHYFQIGGCESSPASGSFKTMSPPNGNTFVDPPLWDDVNGALMFPGYPVSRNVDLIDPQTGAQVRRVTLASDSATTSSFVRGVDAGFYHLCSDSRTENGKADPHGGFRCALQWGGGENGMLYWIHPSGTVRFLGSMNYEGDNDQVVAGAYDASTGFHVDGDPAYPNYVYTLAKGNSDSEAHNQFLIVRFDQNSDAEVAGGAHWAAHNPVLNLTPGPNHSLTSLMVAFDSTFDPDKFSNCSIRAVLGDHLVFQCLNAAQGAMGWVGIFNLGDRERRDETCENKRTNCPRLEALNAVYQRTNSRWCGIDSVMYTVSDDWKWAGMRLATLDGDGDAGGPYQTRLVLGIDAAETNVSVSSWHKGEPMSRAKGYLQDLAMGDYLQFSDTREIVRIAAKSGTLLTVERGCHAVGLLPSGEGDIACDGKTATAHRAGVFLAATCSATNLAGGYWWWDFADAPQGEDSGTFYARDEKMNPVRQDQCVAREPYDICGRTIDYAVRRQAPWTGETFLQQPLLYLDATHFQPVGAGSGKNAIKRPSMNQAAGDKQARSWFTDQSPNGVVQFGLQSSEGPVKVAGVGGSRLLISPTLAGPPRDDSFGPAVANVLSDGSWILWRCIETPNAPAETGLGIASTPPPPAGVTSSPKVPKGHGDVKLATTTEYAHYCMVKVPAQPVDDGIDRTELENVSIAIAPFPGAAKARVKYGYEEYGDRDAFHCAPSGQACYSAISPLVSTEPLKIGIPQHVLFYQVEYLNAPGVTIGSGPVEALSVP